MKERSAAVLGLIVGLVVLAAASDPSTAVAYRAQQPPAAPAIDDSGVYLCPMHPDVTSGTAGTCPRCGMTLTFVSLNGPGEYGLHFSTVPAIIKAGKPIRLVFRVVDPTTGRQVSALNVVHDKPYHLFVISQDLEFFEHIHPQQAEDGTWSVETTLPKPGYYQVLSDFMPSSGPPQFIARPLVTAGYDGDLFAESAHLAPDRVPVKTMDGMAATISYWPTVLWAEGEAQLTVTLTDVATGARITDLQPYLGAFGHALIVSEDLMEFVHSHPVDEPSSSAGSNNLRGGPSITFAAVLPKPGRYRAWTQFQRNGKVYTFPFTFSVGDLDAARPK